MLAALIGLFFTVGKPIINLNKNIVTLNMSVGNLKEQLNKQGNDLEQHKIAEHESHKRLWDYNGEQDKKIDDHEKRIFVLEHK